MSSYILKIIACISMFCDHFGDAFFGEVTFLNYIGRFAFPIFCFQIVQGYIHTHDIKKYILRLSIFAIISQIPFMLFYHVVFDSFAVNVIFTLLFGLLTILIYDKYNNPIEEDNNYFVKDNQRYLITKYGMIMLYRLIKEQITFRYSVRR